MKQWAEAVMAPAACAETYWNEMEGCGWLDSKGRPVMKARPAFQAYAVRWKGNDEVRRKRAVSATNSSPTAYQPNKPPGNGWSKPGQEEAPWMKNGSGEK